MSFKAIKDVVEGLAGPIAGIIDNVHDSKMDKATALAKMQDALNDANVGLEEIGKEIIVAEATSDSWLAKSWRPLGALTFVSLIPSIVIGSFFEVNGQNVATTIAGSIAMVPMTVWTIIGATFAGYTALRSFVDKKLSASSFTTLADSLVKKKKR